MMSVRTRTSDTALLIAFALAIVLLHVAINGRYGFHRDELLTFDNARHLDWGYVVYPPLTPLLARMEILLFGTSLRGFRFFAALAQGLQFLLTGLAARELGGRRWAQMVAASAVAISGFSLFNGGFMSYSTLDYLWWTLAAYAIVRLLRSGDHRWWLMVGAAIGFGLMTRYTIGLLALGILGGLLLTPARPFFRSPWFWAGAAVAALIFCPNCLWQIHNGFIWLRWFHSIHARDLHQGRADYFLLNQFWKCTNPVTAPIWLGGLWYLFREIEGRPWRLLGWMYAVPLVLLLVLRGRDYYLAPAYPVLLAVGAVRIERWMATARPGTADAIRATTWQSFVISGVCIAAIAMPIAPIGTAWWRIADAATDCFSSQIGWSEGVAAVARVRDSLPTEERANYAILAGDDGETGAIDLYGPVYQLPPAISGMNSAWARGYGAPPPQTIIAVNVDPDFLERSFASCRVAAHLSNRWHIANPAVPNADIYVCRNLREPWPIFWSHFQYYG